MDEGKSLTEKITDLSAKVDELSGGNKTKQKFSIPILGWLLSLVIGGFVFTMVWLLWEITYGIIFGIIALSITIYISKIMTSGQWMPFKARFLGRRKKRKGYVVVWSIGRNRALNTQKVQIDEGVIMVNNTPHVVKPEDIFIWKNKIPIVIMPDWSERPINADQHYQKTVEKGETTEGWQYIMNYILKTQIKEKKNIPMAMMIIGVLVVLGLGYYLIKSGAFK